MRTPTRYKKIPILLSLALISAGALSVVTPVSSAATTVSLGSAGSYGVLAGSGISNSGTTTIIGDQGSSPSATYSGFNKVTVTGATHLGDAAAATAQVDAKSSYKNLGLQSSTQLVVTDLGGQILTPGVYTTSASIGITGNLTLDAKGDPNAIFIFRAGSTLTTSSSSSVSMTNGGSQCNVYWLVGSSATLGVNSTFLGTVLASSNITAGTGATIFGRLLALKGTTVLDNNLITVSTCSQTPGVAPTSPAGSHSLAQVPIWPKGAVNTGDGSLGKI
jgi:hypothetical protein